MAPDRLGKYEIRGTLGKGAMGTVYEGWDPIISRKVAIKTVRQPDAADTDAQEELARFKREAQAAGRLTHPNIVGIFDYGETSQLAYIVMECVEGPTLKSILDAGERLPMPRIAKIMTDLLAGLRYSHAHGVIHRDIKPANIMISAEDDQAKIADFGIARIESSTMTQAGHIMGTPPYMSPEQFIGQTVDARTDIYSSGVLLFQLLTGERPFEGSMTTIMHKVLNTVPPKPSDLSVTAPMSLDPVVARAMAKRPEDRFATAAAFAEALHAALANPRPASVLGAGLGDLADDSTVVTKLVKPADRPAQSTPPPAKPRSRAPMFGAASLIVLALAGGGAWFAFSGRVPGAGPVQRTQGGPDTPILTKTPGSGEVVRVEPPQPQAGDPSDPSAAHPPTRTNPPATGPGKTDLTHVPITSATASPPQPATPVPFPSTPIASGTTPPTPTGTVPPEPALTPDPTLAGVTPPVVGTSTANTGSVVAAAAITPDAMRRAVAAAIGTADCALVGGDLSSAGTVSLRGVVVQGGPQAALAQIVRDAAPALPVDWGLGVLNGNYCGALNAVRTYARPFGAPADSFEVALRSDQASLALNDRIEIRATLPSFAAYLTIDYFVSDGSVYHYRLPTTGTQPLPAESVHTLLLGTVQPPYGTDLIIGVASSTPLFGKDTPPKTADAYVRELRAALEAAARRGRVASSAVMVLTAARP